MSDLLPCPFCGSPAEASTRTSTTEIGWDAGLGSPGSHTTFTPVVRCTQSKLIGWRAAWCYAEMMGATPEEAARNWNRRA